MLKFGLCSEVPSYNGVFNHSTKEWFTHNPQVEIPSYQTLLARLIGMSDVPPTFREPPLFKNLPAAPVVTSETLDGHDAEARSHESELGSHVRGRLSKATHVRRDTEWCHGTRQLLVTYARAITCILAYSGQHRDKSGHVHTEWRSDVESLEDLHKKASTDGNWQSA